MMSFDKSSFMKKLIKFKVTSDHIIDGVKRECDKCPIALAFAAYLTKNKVKFIDIGIGRATAWYYLDNDAKQYKYLLSDKAQEFLYEFDNTSRESEPFSKTIKPFFVTLTKTV